MTIEITQEWLHVGIILVLMAVQAYQQRAVKKFNREVTEVWEQMAILTQSIANKITEIDVKFQEIEKRIDRNENKDKETKA